MEWLNYHHLYYFWNVARLGGVVKASQALRLARPTLTGQIRRLEDSLGERLFARQGRRLVMTEMGTIAFRYADEIFKLGQSLVDTVKGRPGDRPQVVTIGVSDAVPKLIARWLIKPAFDAAPNARLICREGRADRLVTELASHEIDVVLADAPLPPRAPVRAYNHLLGECGLSFFGSRDLAARIRGPLPKALDGAPMLLPTDGAEVRRSLDRWLGAAGVRPKIVGEFDDSALMKVFGQAGAGIFPCPSVIEADVRRRYDVVTIGRTTDVREQYFAITIERRVRNPVVLAIGRHAESGFTRRRDGSKKPSL